MEGVINQIEKTVEELEEHHPRQRGTISHEYLQISDVALRFRKPRIVINYEEALEVTLPNRSKNKKIKELQKHHEPIPASFRSADKTVETVH